MPKPIKKQVWNNVDAFAMINGIGTWDDNFQNLKYVRLPDESNVDLRHKINNFKKNPIQGSSQQDLVNGLANELNLEAYSKLNHSTFTLTRVPYPVLVSGNNNIVAEKGVQDVFVYYQEPNASGWTPLEPQHWAADVKDSRPSSGFIVWEDQFYTNTYTNNKADTYSRLLEIYSDLPDKTAIKVVYTIQQFDSNHNRVYKQFTDMDPSTITSNHKFLYRKEYIPTYDDLNIMPVVYDLSHIPETFKEKYFDDKGRGTTTLYQLRDNVDSIYRHRWENINDRVTVWDINDGFSSGTIPSFYDVEFTSSNLDEYLDIESGCLTGGVNYYNPCLYIKDIDIIYNGDREHWYPVLQPGKFYYNGRNHYLMENASGVAISFDSGFAHLPDGIKPHHKLILDKSRTTPEIKYIYEDVDYNINNINPDTGVTTVYKPNDSIARKKAFLTEDMGFTQTLEQGEYMIDYASGIIYSNGISNGVLYWDDVDVPDRVTIISPRTDLNPLNDTSVGFAEYFLTIGE